jgi:hypothetical protein
MYTPTCTQNKNLENILSFKKKEKERNAAQKTLQRPSV